MASSKSASLPGEAKHKGTLACVVLKAKNLPNKRSIGKQDPFAVLSIGTEKQKTKPDKRGGQHPTWDEQLHFEIYDDVEDVLSRRREGSASSTGAGADSSDAGSGTIKAGSQGKASSIASAAPLQKVATAAAGGKKILKVACYADDNKEPEFIGEGLVDLTGVLKTGEFDEWVTIRHKDRYCGEVYLELTFFSSGPRPRRVKKAKPATDSAAGTYGGAGTFTSEIDEADFAPNLPNKPDRNAYPSIPSSIRPTNGHHRPGMSSSASAASVLSTHPGARMGSAPPLEEVPPSLRPSSSLAGIATYTPPYAPPSTHRASSPQPPPPPGMSSSMTMPSMDSHHRSESFSSSISKPEMHSMYVGPHQQQAQHQTNQPYPAGLSHSHSQSFSSIPSSFSTSSVASVGTIRPSSTQPPAHDPIQDLMRPMSSMSVQPAPGRPGLPPTPTPMPVPSPYQHHQSASAPPPAGHPGPPTPQPYEYGQPSHHQPWEQPPHTHAGSRLPSHSYQYGQPSSFSTVAPTPPPQPSSAPPETQSQYGRPYGYSDAPQYGQQSAPPPPPEQDYSQSQHQIHPAQMFVPSHGSAPTPAPVAQQSQPPPRPLSSTSYHALPQVPGSQPSPYRAPSPSPPVHHHPQQPSHYQAPPPQGSVINAQSLYDPYQQQSYQDPYQQQHGRAPSPAPPQPAPPMSSFSQSSYYSPAQQQPQYQSAPTPSNAARPLPPTTPQAAPAGLPPSGSGYYHQSGTPTTGLPPSPGVPYHQSTSYDHQSYNAAPPPQQQPPSPYYHSGQPPQQQQQQYHQPPHGTPLPPSSPIPTPVYQAPPPDQPRYIHSPYDTYAQQQQQQQQQGGGAPPPLPQPPHSPYGQQPTSYYQ